MSIDVSPDSQRPMPAPRRGGLADNSILIAILIAIVLVAIVLCVLLIAVLVMPPYGATQPEQLPQIITPQPSQWPSH